MIAGFVLGWVGIEMVSVFFKARIPYLFNLAIGLVGVLVAYTLVR